MSHNLGGYYGSYFIAPALGSRREHAYGVPAFNVNNLEQMRNHACADATNSPVIVQASAGARKYAGAPFLRHLILAAIEEWPHIPVVMHQDHGTIQTFANVLFNWALAR
jgi:fructose/tagatose bisphosphate aldolase